MRKIFILSISVLILFSFCAPAFAADFEIDISKAEDGLLIIKNIKDTGKRMRLQITLGEEKYVYEIRSDKEQEEYPLQMGNGEYTAKVLQNIVDARYKVITTKNFKVNIKDANCVFLHSIQPIHWKDEMDPMVFAKEIMDSNKKDIDKIKEIYQHMIKNYKYNWSVYNKLPTTYVPDIQVTYKSKMGICYDYSSLTASMLRSMGYPTRLVKGYSTKVNGYHAWNEVFINNEWIIVDTTVDSSIKAPVFRKSPKDYTGTGIY